MKSLEKLTTLLSEAKDAKTEKLIFDIYALVKDEVREEVKQIQEELNIITLLNGKRVDIPAIKDAIIRQIKDEL